jgi:hypothetical protein
MNDKEIFFWLLAVLYSVWFGAIIYLGENFWVRLIYPPLIAIYTFLLIENNPDKEV